MDYASLIADKSTSGSLASRINYALIPAAELVKNAQDEIFARLRVREMRKSLMLPLAAGDSSAALPADFLDAVTLIDSYGCPVKRISDDRLLARRTYDGAGTLIASLPRFYGIFDGAFQFECGSLGAWTLTGMYYARAYVGPAIAATATTPAIAAASTSFLTQRYSNLFWAVLLKIAYGYRKEWDAATRHAADAESLFLAIEQQDDLSFRGLDDDDYAGGRL